MLCAGTMADHLRKRMKLADGSAATVSAGDTSTTAAASRDAQVSEPETEAALVHAKTLILGEDEESPTLPASLPQAGLGGRSMSQLVRSGSFDDTSAESRVCKAPMGGRLEGPVPRSALFLEKTWAHRILHSGKTWELRSKPSCPQMCFCFFPLMSLYITFVFLRLYIMVPRTKKRERICLAQSKGDCLVGEVTIADCLKVAIKHADGHWMPIGDSEEDQKLFVLNPENFKNHQVGETDLTTRFQSNDTIWAWILQDVFPYPKPLPWTPKKGCIVWGDLAGCVSPSWETDRKVPCCQSTHAHTHTIVLNLCTPQCHFVFLYMTYW